RNRLGVTEQGEDTGIVQISMEGEDRSQITKTVNAVANTYLRQNVEAQTQQAQQSLEFLEQQLPEIQADLQQAETQLTEYRKKYQVVGLAAEAQALLEQLVALEAKRSTLVLKR